VALMMDGKPATNLGDQLPVLVRVRALASATPRVEPAARDAVAATEWRDLELTSSHCVTRYSMKANHSPFVRSRTGWLFLRGHAPLSARRTSARALAAGRSRARVPRVGPSAVAPGAGRPSRPFATLRA